MRHETILVVDDHPHMAAALVELVRALGYEAVGVHDGQQALAYVRAHPTGLMLLDLQMPGVSGFDVLRALRADPRLDRLPVVVCSAAPREVVREEAMRLGAQEFSQEYVFKELALARLLDRPVAKVGEA